ncbi:MAG: uroporphyrinogen decarboxylase family protein [Anaerolineae bacterium]
MEMTSRQRLLAALRGQEVDRIPWSPFLAYWWEHQPQQIQERGQVWFFKEIGADPLLRGFATPFISSDIHGVDYYPDSFYNPIPGCETRREVKGDDWRVQHVTPVGTLATLSRYSAAGNTRFVVEHPVKQREDYKILSYIVERMVIEPNYEPIQQAIEELGEDGLYMPLISPFLKTPFQALVEHFVGTQQLVYDLVDYPEEVEALLAVMSERAMEAVQIAVESPAEAFITWEDSSTTNVSPTIFARYIAPEITRWGRAVHAAGKLLVHHACGHVRALLPTMAEEAIDVVESLSPPPTGNIEVWEAQEILGSRVGVIGGIEPTHFLNLGLDGLRDYVEELLTQVNPCHYVLANSDSCPPGVSVEKFRLVTEIVRSHTL